MQALTQAHGHGQLTKARFLPHILIQLYPEVIQMIGRIVDVLDLLISPDQMLLIIQLNGDLIVGLLLPVKLSGRPRGCPVSIGSVEFSTHLPEFIL